MSHVHNIYMYVVTCHDIIMHVHTYCTTTVLHTIPIKGRNFSSTLVNIIIPEMAVRMDHPFIATSFMMFILK